MPNLHGNFSARAVTETVVNVTTTWTALPTTAKSGRALVEAYNKGENKLYFSFDSDANIRHRGAIGSGSFKTFPIQDNLTLYGRAQTGSTRVIVTEYK